MTGWRVALAADGTATWTDPTGRTCTTVPVDALYPLVLPPGGDQPVGPEPRRAGTDEPVPPGPRPAPGAGPRLVVAPDGPHSFLEHRLEHHLPGHWRHVECRVDLARAPDRRWRHHGRAHPAGELGRVRRRVPRPEEPPPF